MNGEACVPIFVPTHVTATPSSGVSRLIQINTALSCHF